jgi:ParB family chromosome partitioning protein
MTIRTITLSSLQPPRANPCSVFDAAGLDGLVASIKTDGLLQNLVVAPAKGKNRFRIISGERRYRALKLLQDRGEIDGSFEIPVEVRKGLSTDDVLRLVHG